MKLHVCIQNKQTSHLQMNSSCCLMSFLYPALRLSCIWCVNDASRPSVVYCKIQPAFIYVDAHARFVKWHPIIGLEWYGCANKKSIFNLKKNSFLKTQVIWGYQLHATVKYIFDWHNFQHFNFLKMLRISPGFLPSAKPLDGFICRVLHLSW